MKCKLCGIDDEVYSKCAEKLYKDNPLKQIAELKADRDEWKQQHENLLSVRQSDLKVITELRTKLAEREWISVSERLPELVKSDNHEIEPMLESERVLTYSNSGYGLDKVYKIGEGKTHFFCERATHWQPLPAAPQPNEKG